MPQYIAAGAEWHHVGTSGIVVRIGETLLMRHRRSSLPWREPAHSREEAIRRGANVPG